MLAQPDTIDPWIDIKTAALAFREKLKAIRAAAPLSDGKPWYPYDILGNIWNLDGVLAGRSRGMFSHLRGVAVADIGAADGDLGFFLESLGAEVDLLDNPATGMNQMAGAHHLKRQLHSYARIHPIDLDTQFTLPRHYNITLLLGILYHLKNPFYVLEQLAKSSSTMLLSTRVAAFTAPLGAPGRTRIADIPAAYLLDAREANNDSTNYWIFSDAGLRRLIHRTGWDIVDYKLMGETEASDPVTSSGDCRAFCYLRSRASV